MQFLYRIKVLLNIYLTDFIDIFIITRWPIYCDAPGMKVRLHGKRQQKQYFKINYLGKPRIYVYAYAYTYGDAGVRAT